MTQAENIDPLHRFPAIRAKDLAEFEHALRAYGATSLVVPDPCGLRARGNLAQLDQIAVSFSACSAHAIVGFDESDFARLLIPLRGQIAVISGRTTTITDDQVLCIASPAAHVTFDRGQDSEHLQLVFPTEALLRILTAELGARPKGSIVFDPVLKASSPFAQGLRALALFLVGQLEAADTTLPLLARRQLEDAIIVAFLNAARHPFSHVLERDGEDFAPAIVRKVEDFIEANWMQGITAEKLFDATGVSTRAIYRAFQRHRGYSPMAFDKTVRLRHANARLGGPNDATTVTGVAFECGFASLGHFAREYRQKFGELPSETLDRATRKKGLPLQTPARFRVAPA